MRCRWEGARGATSSTSGDVDATSARLLILSHVVAAPLIRGDRVALGTIDATEPIEEALVVTTATPYSLSASTPDHWEVEAR